MGDITYPQVIEVLLTRIPELREPYDDADDVLGSDYLPHVVFGVVVNPLVTALLQSNRETELLHRIFAVVEDMANSGDELVREVVGVSVAEYLGGVPGLLALAWPFMGPMTRRISDEIEAGWKGGDSVQPS